jgi:hypothetical protein
MPADLIKCNKRLGRGRIRLPAGLSGVLGWPRIDRIECVGAFIQPGALACGLAAPRGDSVASLPLRDALLYRDDSNANETTSAEAQVQAALIRQYKVFDFEAAWTTDNRLELEVGAHITYLLGWGDDQPDRPLFSAITGQVLVLCTRERIELLQNASFSV